jgi:multimeric flavodoxin WrbA
MARPCSDAVVILGTSRSDGNTRATVNHILNGKSVELADLSTMNIGSYDYQHVNRTDSFLPLVERLIGKSLWLLATPVYWYTMSAQLKLFVDRLSDLVTIRKDLGRALRGKSVGVIASGTDKELPEGFEAPFQLTCNYLGMRYIGTLYLQFGRDDQPIPGDLAKVEAIGESWFA